MNEGTPQAGTVITNIYEFNRRSQASMSKCSTDDLFSQISFMLCGLPQTAPTVITHCRPSDELLGHWETCLGYHPQLIIVPPRTGKLCLDVSTDPAVAPEVLRHLEGVRDILPWGITPELLGLLHQASGQTDARLIQQERLSAWLNNKGFNRALVAWICSQSSAPVKQYPYTYVPADSPALDDILQSMLSTWHSVVVKADASWGGKGAYLCTRSQIRAEILQILRGLDGSPFLNSGFVIEPFLGEASRNLSPSVDWDPVNRRAFVGRMQMEELRCAGTVFGLGALSHAEHAREVFIQFTADAVKCLEEVGYTEWFDVDFLYTDQGIYVSELNLRRTGGTVPVLIAQQLYGDAWQAKIACYSWDGVFTNRTLENILRLSRECGFGVDSSNQIVITAYQPSSSGGARFSMWLGAPDPDHIEYTAKRLLS